MDRAAFESKVETWEMLQIQLKMLKEDEMKLRLEIADHVSNGQVGKFKKEFEADGHTFVVSFGTTLSVDQKLYYEMEDELKEMGVDCFKHSVGLDKRKYNQIDSSVALFAINKVLIEKPSAPTIKRKGDKDSEQD